jgi:hypothetical protein
VTRGRAIAVGVAVLVLIGCSDAESEYTDKVQRELISSCTAAGESEDVCACVYEHLEDDVPFEELRRIDEERRDDPTYLPAELRELAVDCATETLGDG